MILLTKSASYELPKKYEELFSFAVYLPNKRTKKIELAPPVFTFLPYYIDQDKGWSGLYGEEIPTKEDALMFLRMTEDILIWCFQNNISC